MTLKSWKKYDAHTPVLLHELTSSIQIHTKQNIIVDCTLWAGWHAREVLEHMHPWDIFIWFDADGDNLTKAETLLQNFGKGVEKIFVHANYWRLEEELKKRSITNVTGIYYDLGLSSMHLDQAEKGFSFRIEGPLDMRLDKTGGIRASDIVNSYPLKKLEDIFLSYGEEPRSKQIAKAIEAYRAKKRFETTTELAEVIEKISYHPQTKARIFQAIRIEVNKELEQLEKSLYSAIKLLESGGNIFVISFHSLEDRIVKHIFKKESTDCICDDIICTCKHKKQLEVVHKKPILPTEEETKENTRSKSAKGRHARKI